MANKTNADAAPAIDRAFLKFLEQHNAGDAISEISAAMKQVTAATQQTGRAGRVSIELALKPAGAGSRNTLGWAVRVTPHAPKCDLPVSIWYVDEDFNLVRDDPKQSKLDLRIVEDKGQQPVEPLRKVEAT